MATPPNVTVYSCPVQDEPFIPAPQPPLIPWPPTNPYPVPRAEPSSAEQEIGALKHRVGLLEEGLTKHIACVEEKLGLLEEQMRALAEAFKIRGKR